LITLCYTELLQHYVTLNYSSIDHIMLHWITPA